MAINRRMLHDLGVPREAATAIMSAYRETVEALSRERDDALHQLTEVDDLKSRLEEAENTRNVAIFERDEAVSRLENRLAEEAKTERESAIIEELKTAGANPAAIPLLSEKLLSANATPGEAVQEAQMLFPALFAEPQIIGVPRIAPPLEQAGPLTHREISRMSEDEIIKKWRAVQGALERGM